MRNIGKASAIYLLAGLQVGDLADVAHVVPVRADLFGICDGSGGALRSAARRVEGGVETVALPSFREGRL